jgi:hypothetical protein
MKSVYVFAVRAHIHSILYVKFSFRSPADRILRWTLFSWTFSGSGSILKPNSFFFSWTQPWCIFSRTSSNRKYTYNITSVIIKLSNFQYLKSEARAGLMSFFYYYFHFCVYWKAAAQWGIDKREVIRPVSKIRHEHIVKFVEKLCTY